MSERDAILEQLVKNDTKGAAVVLQMAEAISLLVPRLVSLEKRVKQLEDKPARESSNSKENNG